MQFIAKHGLKLLFALKLGVLAMVLHETGIINFGEKILQAQNDAGTQTQANSANPPTDQNEASDNDTSANNTSDSGPKMVSNRKSYLDNLLELPKIDTEDIKKRELSRYLKILERKEEQVKDRIATLQKREDHLKKIENSVEEKLTNLEEEAQFLDQTLQKEKAIQQKRLDQLIEFYKKMDPKRAAPIFENMDRDLVVALFKAIPKKQTMNILGLMNPEKSIQLTEYFGRIRSGQEYEMLVQINKSLREEFQDCKGMPSEPSATQAPQ